MCGLEPGDEVLESRLGPGVVLIERVQKKK